MKMSEEEFNDENVSRKSHVQSLPSDYSDIQPKTYDPEFITDISSKMQVPYKLGGNEEVGMQRADFGPRHGSMNNMMVPDRILVAGEGHHIGMREGLRPFEFTQGQSESDYVGLRTPPRVLTLEETFPTLEAAEERKPENVSQNHHVDPPQMNGSPYGAQPKPYTPQDSLEKSLLLNEQDENIHVQRAIAKLSRRVKVLEDETSQRSQRDMILYIAFAGIVMKGLFGWLWGRLRN